MTPTKFLFLLLTATLLASFVPLHEAKTNNMRSDSMYIKRTSCQQEILAANRTIADWGVAMHQMMNDDIAQLSEESGILQAADKIQESVMSFGSKLYKRPIEYLVKELVAMRRQSNRLALEIYLKTHDTRWPQNSTRFSAVVDRVQRACLSSMDRAAMMVLNPNLSRSQKS